MQASTPSCSEYSFAAYKCATGWRKVINLEQAKRWNKNVTGIPAQQFEDFPSDWPVEGPSCTLVPTPLKGCQRTQQVPVQGVVNRQEITDTFQERN